MSEIEGGTLLKKLGYLPLHSKLFYVYDLWGSVLCLSDGLGSLGIPLAELVQVSRECPGNVPAPWVNRTLTTDWMKSLFLLLNDFIKSIEVLSKRLSLTFWPMCIYNHFISTITRPKKGGFWTLFKQITINDKLIIQPLNDHQPNHSDTIWFPIKIFFSTEQRKPIKTKWLASKRKLANLIIF